MQDINVNHCLAEDWRGEAINWQDAADMLDSFPELKAQGAGIVGRELARRHLSDFATMVHPQIILSPFHLIYYTLLECFAKGELRKLIITMPPQHGKSLGSSVLLPSWLLGMNPDMRIAIASYNATLATRFNRQIMRILSGSQYAAIFPSSALGARTATDPASRNANQIDIPLYSGGTFAVGRGGTLTGNSVDMVIIDDLYKDAMEANSPLIRDNCWEWYTSVVRTRLHNDSGELIVFTRWHEDDLVGRIANHEQITELVSLDQLANHDPQAWIHLNFEALKYSLPTPLDPRQAGEPLWPERHNRTMLEAKQKLDPHVFKALYQGHPCSQEGLLYGERFQTYTTQPSNIIKNANYTDTADTGDDYLCSLCYVVDRNGLIYITDVTYSRQPMEITEDLVAGMLERNNSTTALVESNNGGRGFARALSRSLPRLNVEWFHQSANKEARIISNSSTLLRNILMPHDWALRWPDWHNHIVTYRRTFRANRWHDAADALTGIAEKEASGSGNRIKAVSFKQPLIK